MRQLFENQSSIPLPAATRPRWQPIRGGLLNLYLYDYEEFRYEQGHLILRGNNGTGKSRVMALQLPFLLDGRLASNRVEPDADPSKKMEWNLLMGRHSERLGYTWIEFGRLTPTDNNGEDHDGISRPSSTSPNNGENGHASPRPSTQQFITLGCGLSATQGSGMREPWFFITDQRVGEDLFLQSEAGHALSKSALAEALGDRGTIYVTAKDYRRAVDESLFGLGRQRYEAMVDLLIQLRKPQLSRDLDEKMLARVLGEALPPPSEQMISDVAESFRGLEADRSELNRFRSACEGVDSFLKTYRRYTQVASRRRAAEVRQSQSRYETANRELRLAEKEYAEATENLKNAIAELRGLEVQEEEFEAQIKTLYADPKMRSADAIQQASEQEQQALHDLEVAQQTLNTETARLELRRTKQQAALRQAEARLKAVSELLHRSAAAAANCELKTQHDSVFSSLKLQIAKSDDSPVVNPGSVRRHVEEVITKRNREIEQLEQRNVALAEAERELNQAKKAHYDAQNLVEQAIASQRAAEEQRRGAVEAFLESYQMWHRDSDELLMPAEDDLAADVDEWSQQAEDTNPISIALRQAELDARQTLQKGQAQLQQQADALAVEQSELERLAEQLEQGFHAPPVLPLGVAPSARSSRAGAPFWSLVDFSTSCAPRDRANIEAALEAAGILNAWVTPDGSILTGDFADVLLNSTNAPKVEQGKSLQEILRPDPVRAGSSCAVSDGIILEVLDLIGYGEQNAPTWVASDGRWCNGPLCGQYRKESAHYIGPDARESQRVRKLAEVCAGLKQIEEEASQLNRQIQSYKDRFVAIERQVESIPSDTEIRAAVTSVVVATQQLRDRRGVLTAAERVVTASQTSAERAREHRDIDAQDLGLQGWENRIGELVQNMAAYLPLLAELWPSFDYFESLQNQYEAAVADTKVSEQDTKLCEEDQHEKQLRYVKAKQRLKTLRETIGVEADEIQRRLADAEEKQTTTKIKLAAARTKGVDAEKVLARSEERIDARGKTVDSESELRQQVCTAFQRLCGLGLLKIALESSPEDAPSEWSVSRTVEMARQAESELAQINAEESAWDRIQQTVTTNIQDLNSALSQHAFTPTLSTTDGLYHVEVPYQGRLRSIHELRELLAEEVRQRQHILDEREREIIENHLIGEVASQLHEQIHRALELVDRMNAEIQKRPMSTGMMLKFEWKPDADLSGGIAEMCKKLLSATGTWSPVERVAIGRYLQDHIRDVRAARETGTWHEHLAEALDYRRWHRFWVMKKQDTGWKRLTKRTHGTGSGGEKAVALTIPQFAAAAAHYSSARDDAPRLILLDEAFVGVDPDMRGKCMELISVFDLDFLLTSEIEWGCYAGLPGVAIHQLSTRSGFDAVFLTRWIWNGKQRVKDDLAIPPATRGET